MKIGIVTFHWGTNYGAVLQSYALQQYLLEQGHNVEIINYKPKLYEFSLVKYFKKPQRFLKLRTDLIQQKKEKLLHEFREQYLKQTKRFHSYHELQNSTFDYDVVISGSDQILNPFFTMKGESHPTPTYYLKFLPERIKRIGYAVSFGCTSYPDFALNTASNWINNFDVIGIREKSGLQVLNQLNYQGTINIVPDPTVLMGKRLFDRIKIEDKRDDDYICVYMLRRNITLNYHNIYTIDDINNPISMEAWLGAISNAQGLITNSYHGMIMAILFHVPFVVLLEHKKGVGMNDRFETLLVKIAVKHGLKTACFIRETMKECSLPIGNMIMKYYIKKSDIVTYLTSYDLKTWSIKGRVHTCVIPDIVNPERFKIIDDKEVLRRQRGIKKDEICYLYLGGLNETKGALDLLDAFNKSNQKNAKLFILGETYQNYEKMRGFKKIIYSNPISYRQKCLIEISKNSLNIKLIGITKDVSEWLSIADVVVFPVKLVHQPRPAFEAGYYKIPIILPDYPNFSEIVKDGVNGLLYNRYNRLSLTEKIEMIRDNSLRTYLGENNYKYYLENHTCDILINLIKEYLEYIVKE